MGMVAREGRQPARGCNGGAQRMVDRRRRQSVACCAASHAVSLHSRHQSASLAQAAPLLPPAPNGPALPAAPSPPTRQRVDARLLVQRVCLAADGVLVVTVLRGGGQEGRACGWVGGMSRAAGGCGQMMVVVGGRVAQELLHATHGAGKVQAELLCSWHTHTHAGRTAGTPARNSPPQHACCPHTCALMASIWGLSFWMMRPLSTGGGRQAEGGGRCVTTGEAGDAPWGGWRARSLRPSGRRTGEGWEAILGKPGSATVAQLHDHSDSALAHCTSTPPSPPPHPPPTPPPTPPTHTAAPPPPASL